MIKATSCIYKITSPINHIYIGQTVNFERRIAIYKSKLAPTQSRLNRSFLKYGFENHKIEIIHECSQGWLNELEKFYIIYYDTFNTPHGLNLLEGGRDEFTFSEETKNKLRIKLKGRKRPPEVGRKISAAKKGKCKGTLGIPCSEDKKKKISAANKGRKSPLKGVPRSPEVCKKIGLGHKGKKLSEEHKKQISKFHKGRKVTFSEEHRKNLSIALTGKSAPWQYKKVRQSDLFTDITYESIKDAAKQTGINEKCISAACRGRSITSGGFKWQYV